MHFFLPLAATPLHYGHINLLHNVLAHGPTTLLLTPHTVRDGYNFSRTMRKKRLQQACTHYQLPTPTIHPLPTFRSSITSDKSTQEVTQTKNIFQQIFDQLAQQQPFTIITGNPQIQKACQQTYHFPCIMIGTSVMPLTRQLDIPNPFPQLHNNGQLVRKLITQHKRKQVAKYLPPFVLQKCQNLRQKQQNNILH